MKKFFILILMFVFVLNVSQAFGATAQKIEEYISTLESKLAAATTPAKKVQLRQLIQDANVRLKAPAATQAPNNESADLADLKEELNIAIAGLNSKIEEVNGKAGSGATVAGRAYINWYKDLKAGSTTPNQFTISRVYLDYKKALAQDAAVRLTTDVGYESTLSHKWNTYLKYAYFDLANFSKYVPAAGFFGLENVIIGQSATHWIDFMQNYWTYRYVVKTLTDHHSLFNSADLGVAAKGGFDFSGLEIPFLSRINYHATLMNGEGYKSAEANQGKDLGVTLMTEPVRWGEKDFVTVALGYLVEDVPLSTFNLNGLAKKLTAMSAYNFTVPAPGIVFVEYANQQDANVGGYCFGGQYQVLDQTNLFGRYDSYKKSGSDYAQQIYGIEYLWGSNTRLALDYQHETKGSADNAKKIYLHSEVKW